MKNYVKPMIAEAELFTQDAIAVSIPKTRYKLNSSGQAEFLNVALQGGDNLSGLTGKKYNN